MNTNTSKSQQVLREALLEAVHALHVAQERRKSAKLKATWKYTISAIQPK